MDKLALKSEIIAEISNSYASNNLDELVDLLLDVMVIKTNYKELAGIQERQYLAYCTVFEEDSTINDIKLSLSDVMKVEPILKKILTLINETEYENVQRNKKGLAYVIKKLGLNPNNDNLNVSSDVYAGTYFEHVVRSYSLRNSEAHTYENWTRREIYTNLDSVLICCIKTIEINKHKIEKTIKNELLNNELSIDSYLKDLINQFKSRMSRFIHIRGEENFSFLERYVVENQDEKNESKRRKGTVEQLRDTQIPEKRMLIWGEAGMGKSTTLEYLTYIDAKKRLINPTANIPILVTLGLMTRASYSIKQYICDRLKISMEICETLLEDGNINLFLDGLNEIPNDAGNNLKTLRLREIKQLLKNYPKTFIIITNRPQDSKDFDSVPIFNLIKLSIEEITDFINKNVDDKEIEKIIMQSIKGNDRFISIINTPLILSRLIEIVKFKKTVPQSEGDIIASFLDCLFDREKIEKQDARLDKKRITYLLRKIAFESLEKKAANAGMTESEVLKYCKLAMEQYSFQYDALYALEMMLQLGILELREGLYVFSHQAYQDYYYALEELAVLTS